MRGAADAADASARAVVAGAAVVRRVAGVGRRCGLWGLEGALSGRERRGGGAEGAEGPRERHVERVEEGNGGRSGAGGAVDASAGGIADDADRSERVRVDSEQQQLQPASRVRGGRDGHLSSIVLWSV